ncbi:MAG: hypothetical protein FJW36_22515 [Acidobacteria bacterium]|nr:hypothetical protein [Acidobacteriota bacterium]
MHNFIKIWITPFFLTFGLAAQVPLPSRIVLEVEHYVEYLEDTTDPFKRGSNPALTTVARPLPNTFLESDHLADIVTVNGQAAKGLMYGSARVIGTTTSSTPGRPIADISTSTYRSYYFQILNADGTYIGTIFASGLQLGNPPPGSPSGVELGEYAIVGGSGVFQGVRGQAGMVNTVTGRLASASEDPSQRRVHPGGKTRFILSIYPMVYPQVLTANGLPAITHADFKQVTAAAPAVAGEILSVFTSGMGPTRPGVEPGASFPQSPLAVVTSPVQVTVGGVPAEVLSAVGYPGATDGCQVNFKMPAGVTRGNAQVRVSSAWIGGVPVSMPVQ